MEIDGKQTILDPFLKAASLHPDHPAFNYFDQVWKELSYGQFLRIVQGIASHLIRSGVGPGSRIALLSENRFEWCASYLGILVAGGVTVPIESQLGPREIENLLVDSEATLLFCSGKTRTRVGDSIRTVNFDSPGFKEICETPQMNSCPRILPEDLASIVYTSGTTGRPKGVMLSHGNFSSDALAIIEFGIVKQQDNVLAALPLHHTYSLTCTFLLPIFMGATITLAPSLKGPELLSAIRERGVSIFMAVPQMLELLRDGMIRRLKAGTVLTSLPLLGLLAACRRLRRRMDWNLGKLIFRRAHQAFGEQFRLLTSGGARLDPQVMEDLEGLGFTVLEGYGLTETSPVITFNPIERRKPGSAGKALPLAEVKIVDPSEAGEGEIAAKGPMIMKGYYRNPEGTAAVMRDGWFLTGDLGCLDEEKYLFITGRKKEVIVLSSGKKVYPEEVEEEYGKIPVIKEIGVLEWEEGGEVRGLYGLIVPNLEYARETKIGNLQDAVEGAIHRVSAGLPSYKALKGFGLIAQPLPRTPMGKVKRHLLKDFMREIPRREEEDERDRGLLDDETGRRVVECITVLRGKKSAIHSSDNLELDLGLDSLQRIELIVALEDAFSVKLPESFESEIQTVGDLVARIKGLGGAPSARREVPRGEGLFTGEPSEEEKKKIGLYQSGAEWSLVLILLKILRSLFRILFDLKVKGVENLPDPPFIIAPNHLSNLDGFVVAVALPPEIFRILHFQGYEPYFRPWPLSRFARMVHVIPIAPETDWLKAFALSSYVLRRKRALCIFAEGERSWDGDLKEFKKGIGTLAKAHGVAVVPAWIDGTFQILPRNRWWPRPGKMRIVFGKPLRFDEVDLAGKPPEVEEAHLIADQVREKVRQLQELEAKGRRSY